jgi:hypothetical protein
MKRSIRVLVPAMIASLASFLAANEPALAASCTVDTTTWENSGRCPSPNQNRGDIFGNGILNNNNRGLVITVSPGNISGQGRGLRLSGGSLVTASGPNGNCLFTVASPQTLVTPSGRCNNGTRHRLTITF